MKNKYLSSLLALFAGGILPLAFAPLNYYLIAFVSPTLLLFIWRRATPKQAFFQGLWFGIGSFGVGVSWVYVSIHTFGHAPILFSLILTALFVICLALFPATQGLIVKLLTKQNDLALAFIFPATWVIWEYLRSTLFTGFPWLLLGYTQINTPLRGFAPLFSIYGVSLVTTLITSTIFLLLTRHKLALKITSAAMILIIFAAGIILSKHAWTQPQKTPIQVSLLQPNISLAQKWQPQALPNIINTLNKMTLPHLNSQLIIWPEAAIPAFPNQVSNYLATTSLLAKKYHSTIITGIFLANRKKQAIYNGLIVLGNGHGQYLKRHLVPFGEYFPFPKLAKKILGYLKIPMSSLSAGQAKQPPLTINGTSISPFICYEIAFPKLVLDSLDNSQMLLTITEDSWFGRSFASAQHLQMAQMRALETGRYLLFDANSGITAVINPQGQIIARAPRYQQSVLTATVYAMQGATPLMRWRFLPIILLTLLFLFAGLLLQRLPHRRRLF